MKESNMPTLFKGSRVRWVKNGEYTGTVSGFIKKDDDGNVVNLVKVIWDASERVGIPMMYRVGRSGGYDASELVAE